jgi:hypothetical protein
VSTKGGRRPKSPTSEIFAYLYFFLNFLLRFLENGICLSTQKTETLCCSHSYPTSIWCLHGYGLGGCALSGCRYYGLVLPPRHHERSIYSVFLVSVVSQSSFPIAEFRLCDLNSNMVWKMHCNVAVKYGESVTEKSVNDNV